jgi:hypothetical protein
MTGEIARRGSSDTRWFGSRDVVRRSTSRGVIPGLGLRDLLGQLNACAVLRCAAAHVYRCRGDLGLPVEGLISKAALARSTAKSLPAVSLAFSTPPLNPVLFRPPHVRPTYSIELSKLRVEHTPCTDGVARVGLTAWAACTPFGGCDDEHPQAHSRGRV